MVLVKRHDGRVTVTVDIGKSPRVDELADFLEEQVEIWLNKEKIQKNLNRLDKEETVAFKFK